MRRPHTDAKRTAGEGCGQEENPAPVKADMRGNPVVGKHDDCENEDRNRDGRNGAKSGDSSGSGLVSLGCHGRAVDVWAFILHIQWNDPMVVKKPPAMKNPR